MNKHHKALELDKILSRLAENCISEGAKTLAVNTIPEVTLDKARELIQKTDDAYKLIAGHGTPSFGGARDITPALTRAAAGGALNNKELLHIAALLSNIGAIKGWRERCEGVKTSLDHLFAGLFDNKPLQTQISHCIKSEDEINDNASPALSDIRRKIARASNSIREKLDKLVRSAAHQKHLQEAIITQRNGRFVVPVKAEFRGEVQGLVHDTSKAGSTLFIEPMAVVQANNEIKILHSAEAEEIERILAELTAEVALYKEELTGSLRLLTHLDYIFAKAKLAFSMKALSPNLNDKNFINLKSARHPLLPSDSVVPIDVALGGEYNTLVITGPNTGGKTVTLKTIGLLSLMAACGLLVPCADGSEVPIFSNVFADIGDEQSIEQSLSTFSSHIKNIISIMKEVDSNSLVLLDELCSGTDPVEGAALAIALLEAFRHSCGALAATTHYAELKAYALDTTGVVNAGCEFDITTLAPTYRLLIGAPGRSNAFLISSKLGMQMSVIDKAKSLVTAENTRFERVIGELEARQKAADDARILSEQKLKSAESALKAAEETAQKTKKEYTKQIEQAKATARIISDNAKIEANRLIDELKELKKSQKADVAAAEKLTKSALSKLDDISVPQREFKEDYTLPRPLKIGDTVLTDTDQKATVLALPDNKNRIIVQAGIMKIKIAADRVKLVEESGINIPKSIHKTQKSGIDSKSTRTAALELDLRGMMVDEAEIELDRFIDNALLSNIEQFTLIHGKGTGALRKGLHTFLKKHPSIRTFRLGVFGEGENGVTIVELK